MKARSGPRCGLLMSAILPFAACRPAPAVPQQALRVALPVAPATLDPHWRNEFLTFAVLANVFEGLTSLSAALRVEPALAESWHNIDERTWRFRLRPKVSFHDGRPLTAADVVFSLERVRRLPGSEFKSYLASLASLREVSPEEVEIVTERPNAVLLSRLAFVMIVPVGSPDRIEVPVGTGAYRVAGTPDGAALHLARFEQHWAAPAPFPKVEMLAFRPPEGVDELLRDHVAFLQDVAPGQVDRLRDAGFRIVSYPGPAVDVLQMRVTAKPFSDPRVRHAISLALDRQKVVEQALLGHGAPASQIVSRNVFGRDPGFEPPARDLAGARRLLAQAGYGAGLDVSLEYRREVGVEIIAGQLREAGIRARLVPRDWTELLDRLARRQVDFAYLSLVSDSGDSGDLFDSTLHSSDAATGYGDSNETGYSNPDLDALIESAGQTADLERRRLLLQDCMRRVMRDLPIVPVLERHLTWAMKPDVAFTPRADGRVVLRDLKRVQPAAVQPAPD